MNSISLPGFEHLTKKKSNPRVLPVDLIYSGQDGTGGPDCCMACFSGLKYGTNSERSSLNKETGKYEITQCKNVERYANHKLCFIDNPFKKYNHKRHFDCVKNARPKYATVRDIMSEEQCREARINYYPFEQIMEWAYELEEYVENVIVIPKIEKYIDMIPGRFLLGYSIPTSHGGTPIHIDAFRKRKIHLLGGSWKNQVKYLEMLGDDVVSLDNNYVQLIAKKWANFVDMEGNTTQVKELFPHVVNPRYVALAISFGNMAAKINKLYGE